MKVKILLIPLVLVTSLALCIWLVFPAYFEMQSRKKQLEKENSQVADLEQKKQKVEELMSSLNENADKQALILKFLPDSRKEEEIIRNLNEIVSQEGLSVSNISVHKPKADASLSGSAVNLENTQNSASSKAESQSKIKKFEVDLNMAGGYDKINNAINKINALKRFNRAVKLKIGKLVDKNNQEIGDSLQANFVLEFNYMEMEKIESVTDTNNQIFSSGKFDISAVEKIQKLKNTEVLSVNLETSGKNNPFLP